MTRVLVIGAGGAVGEAIAHALLTAGCEVIAAARRDCPEATARLQAAGAITRKLDLDNARDLGCAFSNVSAAVLTPILTTSVRAARPMADAGLASAVFFSSNNVAADPADPVYVSLEDAERQIRAILPHATILRPTLIYGDPRLTAMARLVRFLRRSPVLPIPGHGAALQQPVFYEDLARAAAAVARDPTARSKTFAIGGPDTVSQREMYLLLSRIVGGVRIPVPAPRALLNVLRTIAPLPLDAAQIARLDADKAAVPVDPLPALLSPCISLEEGFRRLVAAVPLDERAWRPAPGPA